MNSAILSLVHLRVSPFIPPHTDSKQKSTNKSLFLLKNMKPAHLLLIVLLFPINLQAKTGAQLREDCAAFDERPDSSGISTNMMRMSECLGYIHGVLDVPNLYIVRGADYCVPDGTTRNAVFNVAREYVRRTEVSKMTWAGSGSQAVINAIMSKWPCKEMQR